MDEIVSDSQDLRRAKLFSWAGDFMGLVIPVACAGCGCPDSSLCGECLAEWSVNLLECGVFDGGSVNGLFPIVSAGVFEKSYAQAIRAYKEYGRVDIGQLLARRLNAAICSVAVLSFKQHGLPPPGVVIAVVPLPSNPRKTIQRGYRPVHRMVAQCSVLRRSRRRIFLQASRSICRLRVADCLRLSRAVKDQRGLSSLERRHNMAGAMAISQLPVSKVRWAILVDDVVTTGATLHEGRRVLEKAGVRVLGAATLAITRLRRNRE